MSMPPSADEPEVISFPVSRPARHVPDRAVEAGRGALFIGAAKGVFMLSGFVQQVLLARVITPAALGAFGVVNSAISAVNNTVVQATIQSVSKYTAENDARAVLVKRAALRIQVVVGVLLGLGFFLAAPILADFEKAPQYTPYYRIAALIPMLYAIYAVFIGSVNGLRKFRTQAGFDMTFSAAKTVLLLGAAAVFDVAGAFGGFAAAAVFILIAAVKVIGIGKVPQPAPGMRPMEFAARQLGGFMVAVGGYNLLLNVALLYDQPLLHHFAGVVDPAAAGAVAGHYQALRTLALLPYQALLVVTFVIFPLVSRATFQNDNRATKAYVTQTLRYALILATAMGVALAARPGALLATLFPPAYGEGATALPILVVGECCLALLAVSCAILNAADHAVAAFLLMMLTVCVGISAMFLMVPGTRMGADMLVATATATTLGMVAGFLGSVLYVRIQLGGNPPLLSLGRIAIAAAVAVGAGRVLPGQGKIAGLAITVLMPIIYMGVLIALREFGPEDIGKIKKIVKRGGPKTR